MDKDLEVALRDFLAFGKPCEGSFRYHDAWKKLHEAYYPIVGFKKGEIALDKLTDADRVLLNLKETK